MPLQQAANAPHSASKSSRSPHLDFNGTPSPFQLLRSAYVSPTTFGAAGVVKPEPALHPARSFFKRGSCALF